MGAASKRSAETMHTGTEIGRATVGLASYRLVVSPEVQGGYCVDAINKVIGVSPLAACESMVQGLAQAAAYELPRLRRVPMAPLAG